MQDIDLDALGKLSQKVDLSEIMKTVGELDDRQLAGLMRMLKHKGGKKGQHKLPPIDGDFYDLALKLTPQQRELQIKVRNFMEELARNNDREWFRAQKARYDSEVKRPAERLLLSVTRWLESANGLPVRSKLFRPHRDVRFSQDKTPYYTHLHAAWSVPDGRAWYFGLSPDYATAGCGVMAFDEAQLLRWRRAVDGPQALTTIRLFLDRSIVQCVRI